MIAIIDYNAGNTKSVMNALNRLNADFILTADASAILAADKVILPGVGHAGSAMAELIKRDLVDTIKKINAPFLGVCVGMQIMQDWSEEGDTICLGLIPGRVVKFQSEEYKIPKIGWNTLKDTKGPLFENLSEESYYYFVHSYYSPLNEYSIATANYIQDYSVAIQKGNIFGLQFHPEKSAIQGAQIIKNFIEL